MYVLWGEGKGIYLARHVYFGIASGPPIFFGLDIGLLKKKVGHPSILKKEPFLTISPGRNSFWLNPERNPRHHDNQTGWNVSVKKVVAQASSKFKDHLQTSEIA